jgi:hypothetical protein
LGIELYSIGGVVAWDPDGEPEWLSLYEDHVSLGS